MTCCTRQLWKLPILLQCLLIATTAVSIADDRQTAGSLVICGGGALPDTIYEQFRSLAGNEARLVVIPTATSREIDEQALQNLWHARGFPNVTVLHTRDPKVASTPAFVLPLKSATAVWFGGGSQQRIADAYCGTRAEAELHELLERGGVIGGTSAGAAIQSKVMIAGGSQSPEISTGFNLLKGTIIDQHFLRRNRIARLMAAVRQHPKLVGAGIDEGTALVLQNGEATVIGRSYVTRIQLVDDSLAIDAFNHGEKLSLTKH